MSDRESVTLLMVVPEKKPLQGSSWNPPKIPDIPTVSDCGSVIVVQATLRVEKVRNLHLQGIARLPGWIFYLKMRAVVRM